MSIPRRRPIQKTEDGFLGKADPVLLQALEAELMDEIAAREGGSRVDPPEPIPLDHKEWLARDFVMIQRWRHRKLAELMEDPSMIEKLYANDPIKFICHWCDTYEPRNAGKGLPTRMPLLLFRRQEALVQFYHACLVNDGNGLVEKSRDMGATWCGVGYSIWLWRFVPGTSVGWGSANSDKLDRLGDANSIFEKVRLCIRGLPVIFRPKKFKDENLMFKRVVNADTGSAIVGEIGDQIGRGGRTRIYFVDEAAWLERPDAVEAALSENTRVRIDISSVSPPGTLFHRTRQTGVEWSPGKPILKDRANVFLLDWRDHPEKNEQWLANRKHHFESRGLGHVFAREIERNYAATTEVAIIRPEWVEAAFDAHKKLGITLEPGKRTAGFDIADEGGGSNACVVRDGQLVKAVKDWHSRDTAISTRAALEMVKPFVPIEMHYDCVGMGAGVRSEVNRLKDDDLMPEGVIIVPWHPQHMLIDPHEKLFPDDVKSMTNFQFFSNFKAQAWWNTRTLLFNTWRMVTQGEIFLPDQIVSIDCANVDKSMQHKLRDELSQVIATTHSAKMKWTIVKAPANTYSPNLADAFVMAFWPAPLEPDGVVTSFYGPTVIKG